MIQIIYNAKTQEILREYKKLNFDIMLDEMLNFKDRQLLRNSLKTGKPVQNDISVVNHCLAFENIDTLNKYRNNKLNEW